MGYSNLKTALGEVFLDNSNLKKAGLKVTSPRRKILEIMEKAKEHHLSAEDIYRTLIDMDEEIGLATVYRVLTQFEEAGLVIKHHFEGGQSIFELDHGMHHDHLRPDRPPCVDSGVRTSRSARADHAVDSRGAGGLSVRLSRYCLQPAAAPSGRL